MPDDLDKYLDPVKTSSSDSLILKHSQRTGLDPELVRSTLLRCLGLHLRTLLREVGQADVLRLLEHAVRVNGVEVVP